MERIHRFSIVSWYISLLQKSNSRVVEFRKAFHTFTIGRQLSILAAIGSSLSTIGILIYELNTAALLGIPFVLVDLNFIRYLPNLLGIAIVIVFFGIINIQIAPEFDLITTSLMKRTSKVFLSWSFPLCIALYFFIRVAKQPDGWNYHALLEWPLFAGIFILIFIDLFIVWSTAGIVQIISCNYFRLLTWIFAFMSFLVRAHPYGKQLQDKRKQSATRKNELAKRKLDEYIIKLIDLTKKELDPMFTAAIWVAFGLYFVPVGISAEIVHKKREYVMQNIKSENYILLRTYGNRAVFREEKKGSDGKYSYRVQALVSDDGKSGEYMKVSTDGLGIYNIGHDWFVLAHKIRRLVRLEAKAKSKSN